MYLIKLFHSIKNPYSVKTVSKLLSFNNVLQKLPKRNFSAKLNIPSKIEKDVVLFKMESPRFFIYLNLFSGFQCVLWSYLGVFLFGTLENARSNKQKKYWGTVISDPKYIYILSAVAVIFGCTVFIGTLFYTARSVRKIVLHKGGRNLTITTYKLPGIRNSFKLPISKVSAAEHRGDAKKFVSLKIKDKFFFYILDTSGEFPEPELFDFTAGIKRNF